MQSEEKSITQENNATSNKPNKKNDKFRWWQAVILIVLTLSICVIAGYFISDKYLWADIDESRLNERLTHYKDLVDLKPNDPQTRVELGYVYFLKGNHAEAIKQYEVAINLDENYFNAYLNLAIIYNEQDRIDDVLEMATKATEISPRDYKGHLMKGIAYRKLKMYEEATKTLFEADKLMPANTDIIYEIGKVAEDQGDKKKAEEIYKEALEYDPLYKPALNGLERIAAK
jgi:tetratricopeptide (TPR) repeat protein